MKKLNRIAYTFIKISFHLLAILEKNLNEGTSMCCIISSRTTFFKPINARQSHAICVT